MPVISLRQLHRRTRHELISDELAFCADPILGPTTVRHAERTREARYPNHRRLRQAAVRHFQEKGWDVVPHGVGVWGAKAVMADLVISKGKKIVFVECLTKSWVTYHNTQKKRRLEAFFPLWFVVEDPAADFEFSYSGRVERLARRSRVFFLSKGRTLSPYPTRPFRGPSGRTSVRPRSGRLRSSSAGRG